MRKKQAMTKGRFITLEGGDGAGKSTQAHILADRLRSQGCSVVLTREPGGAPGAETIRTLLVEGALDRWQPMSEALLHMAARVEHVTHLIQPALDRGAWVVCDRFIDSTRVYQGHVQKIGEEVVDDLYRIALGTLMPDITLILNLPISASLQRMEIRGGREDRYERMGENFHKTVLDAFRALAEKEPQRCRMIDADGSPEQVSERIWQVITPLLEAC